MPRYIGKASIGDRWTAMQWAWFMVRITGAILAVYFGTIGLFILFSLLGGSN